MDPRNFLPIHEIRDCATRIAPFVRRTPCCPTHPASEVIDHPVPRSLKLECLQVTGAFKARGAVHAALRSRDAGHDHWVTASGGNHGLGVAWAARALGGRATIVLPANAPVVKQRGVERLGATVIRHGDVWDAADDFARSFAREHGAAYVHAFADRDVLLGQGTIALEWLEDVENTDVLVVPIGGGGLIGGVAAAAKQLRPSLRIIGVEPVGAPTLRRSLDAGRVIALDHVDTAANTLAPRRSHETNLALVQEWVDDVVLVDDDEMRRAAVWLWDACGVAAELSGAAASAAILTGRVRGEQPSAIVCGRGDAGTRPAAGVDVTPATS